jgi:hypothetical protein
VLEKGVRARRSFRSHFLLRGWNGNGPAVASADDGAGRDETHQGIAEPLVADAELSAQLRAAEGTSGAAKNVEHEGIEVARSLVLDGQITRDDSEMDVRIVAGHELKAKRVGSGGGTVLDSEDERVLLPSHVQIGVAPGVEVAASPK